MNYNIKTERLLLRPPSENDDRELFKLMEDKKLTTFLTWEAHKSIITTRNVIQSLIVTQKEGSGYHWCICLDDQIIGLVSLIDVRRKLRTWTLNRAELSYLIGEDYQGKGFATEASKAVVNYGFEVLELHKIIIAHTTKNKQSGKICAKLGFKKYANENDAFMKNGEWHDLLWYEQINK